MEMENLIFQHNNLSRKPDTFDLTFLPYCVLVVKMAKKTVITILKLSLIIINRFIHCCLLFKNLKRLIFKISETSALSAEFNHQ